MSTLSELETRLCAAVTSRRGKLLEDLRRHVDTPTGPGSAGGLEATRNEFSQRLSALGAAATIIRGEPKEEWLLGEGESREAPPVLVCRRRRPGHSILLCGHLDTVHPVSSDFRSLTLNADGSTATGPGCVDMKGGLVIAINALEVLEECGVDISWGFIFNSDEETGSYSSDAALRAEAASGYDAGLVFEPAMANGGLAIQRSGSGQFKIVTRGKAGHVGRDFRSCVSAVTALGRCIVAVGDMADADRGAITNIGPIQGGAATNIVPDSAAAWGNVRFETPEIATELAAKLDALATGPDALPGVEVLRSFHRPSKPLTPAVQHLADMARMAATDLGQQLPFGKTGGVCDGNNLQAAGLPVIDTLGVRGGGLHTTSEWIEIPSLVERCQLTCVALRRLAEQGVRGG